MPLTLQVKLNFQDYMNSSFLSNRHKYGVTAILGLSVLTLRCAAEPGKETKDRLNVLLLIADDLRWNSLGCMGNSMLKTPNIDNLAKDGIRFTDARVTTSISMVSRATMLTGMYMRSHGIRQFGIQIDPAAFMSTYPAILRKAGYWTGYAGKYGVGKLRSADFDFSTEYEGRHWLRINETDSVHVTEKNKMDAIKFLRDRPGDRPFLLTVGFFATHAQDNHPDQYLYQPESEKYYRDDIIPVPETSSDEYFKSLPYFLATDENEGRIRWHWRFDTPQKYQKYMKAYYRILTEMDLAVGRIIDELIKQDVYDKTLIIFIGDNGYFHGEHGLADKWYPYEEALRIPLIIHDPRLPVSARDAENNEFVLNADIAPTIIKAVGEPVPRSMQGKDLSGLYLTKKPVKWRRDFYYEHPFVTSERRIPSSEAIVTHRDKYICWPFYNYEEYYDLQSDPLEKQNRIGDSSKSERIRYLKKRLNLLKNDL
jgi:arylsulfatase A-like enzyme